MRNLLKLGLLRIVKDKLFLVTIIVIVATSVVMPLSNVLDVWVQLMRINAADGTNTTLRELKIYATTESISMLTFSVQVLILIIFTISLIVKEFRQNTIRNKVLIENRFKIYVSNLIAFTIYFMSFLLLGFTLTLAINSIFFNFMNPDMSFLLFIGKIVEAILVWLSILSLIICIGMNVSNAMGVLAITVGVILGLTLAAELVSLPMHYLYNESESIMNAILRISPLAILIEIRIEYYSFSVMAYIVSIVMSFVYIGLFNLIGYNAFSKRNIR